MWIYLNIEGFLIALVILYAAYKVWSWLGQPMGGDDNNG